MPPSHRSPCGLRLGISSDGKKVIEKRLQEQGFTREGTDSVNELARPCLLLQHKAFEQSTAKDGYRKDDELELLWCLLLGQSPFAWDRRWKSLPYRASFRDCREYLQPPNSISHIDTFLLPRFHIEGLLICSLGRSLRTNRLGSHRL